MDVLSIYDSILPGIISNYIYDSTTSDQYTLSEDEIKIFITRELIRNRIRISSSIREELDQYTLQNLNLEQHQLKAVYEEYFTDNRHQWPIAYGIFSSYKTKIAKGVFTFQHKKGGDHSYSLWDDVKLVNQSACSITSTMKHIGGITNHGFGLVWGGVINDHFHEFVISCEEWFRIATVENEERTLHMDWTYSPDIRGSGVQNKLSILNLVDRSIFYINDIEVCEIPRLPNLGDNIGFTICQNQTIEVENLIVKN